MIYGETFALVFGHLCKSKLLTIAALMNEKTNENEHDNQVNINKVTAEKINNLNSVQKRKNKK